MICLPTIKQTAVKEGKETMFFSVLQRYKYFLCSPTQLLETLIILTASFFAKLDSIQSNIQVDLQLKDCNFRVVDDTAGIMHVL